MNFNKDQQSITPYAPRPQSISYNPDQHLHRDIEPHMPWQPSSFEINQPRLLQYLPLQLTNSTPPSNFQNHFTNLQNPLLNMKQSPIPTPRYSPDSTNHIRNTHSQFHYWTQNSRFSNPPNRSLAINPHPQPPPNNVLELNHVQNNKNNPDILPNHVPTEDPSSQPYPINSTPYQNPNIGITSNQAHRPTIKPHKENLQNYTFHKDQLETLPHLPNYKIFSDRLSTINQSTDQPNAQTLPINTQESPVLYNHINEQTQVQGLNNIYTPDHPSSEIEPEPLSQIISQETPSLPKTIHSSPTN